MEEEETVDRPVQFWWSIINSVLVVVVEDARMDADNEEDE